MPRLVVNVDTKKVKAAEMRRELAQILSKLPGDQPVEYYFRISIEDYRGKYTKHDKHDKS